MLQIKNLTKSYWLKGKEIKAVDALNLEIKANEVFGFLGPNGAGKTTTIKLILGLLRPDQGTIRVNGFSPDDLEMKNQIGFLPENPYFYQYLTGHEFLTFCGNLFGIAPPVLRQRIQYLIEIVSLPEAVNIQLRYFSKGMLQRIGIAQSLINCPRFILLDEPMSGLDPIGRKEVKDIILNLKKTGATIFLCSHILEDIETLCDRIGIIHKGKLVASGSLKMLTKGQSLESYFLKVIQENTKE
jgi:ABC-2 type transport system ATP-binding protein